MASFSPLRCAGHGAPRQREKRTEGRCWRSCSEGTIIGRAEDVAHLVHGLSPDVGGNEVGDHTHGTDDGSHVVGVSSYRDEVGDEIDGHDDIGQGTDDGQLDVHGHTRRHHHIVKDQHVVHELRAHLGCTLGQLVPETSVRILVTVGVVTNVISFSCDGYMISTAKF